MDMFPPPRKGVEDNLKYFRRKLATSISMITVLAQTAPAFAATVGPHDDNTMTPIKHVIIIVGENRTFDHLFATYTPPSGFVNNLLSQGIVKADGTPGPNVTKALQFDAVDAYKFNISPKNKHPYTKGGEHGMPPIMTGGAPSVASDTNPAPFATLAAAEAFDYGLESQPANDYVELTTGATGLPTHAIDTRHEDAAHPINAPFQITPQPGNPGISYDDYAASPVHRFYQMFQQLDCSAANVTGSNPSGCLNDLFPWVETTVGAGSNGNAQPVGFTNQSTGEGSTSMGFYNMAQGDVPYFKQLADTYAIGDNYHQPIKGGTGADSVVLGFAFPVYYQDVNGYPATPPSNQIENPNPQAGTNNYYTQDGYGGGTYTNCSDRDQPAVAEIKNYLASLPSKPPANCKKNTFYLLNNYNPGYNGDGTPATLGADDFTIPPQHQRSIANTLDEAGVSWTYYGEAWNAFVANPNSGLGYAYCNICNPFLYQSYVMTNPAERKRNLKDTTDLYSDLRGGVLPAVSWVKPGGLNDGHPSSSKYDIFEAYVKKIVDLVQASPTLAGNTAILITNDEGGGYYDSGMEQALDYFGDGTRIPMIVVSAYSKGVGVVHSYGDHVSFIKFVNANWRLKPIDKFTRDNLPNPVTTAGNPYVPNNMPAIDDLMGYFNFPTNN